MIGNEKLKTLITKRHLTTAQKSLPPQAVGFFRICLGDAVYPHPSIELTLPRSR